MAAIACVTDAVLLAHVDVAPSLFCQHYAGRAGGPTSPFGFGLGGLDGELEAAPLLCPYLVAARTRILDYSSARVGSLQPDHLILQARSPTGTSTARHLTFHLVSILSPTPSTHAV